MTAVLSEGTEDPEGEGVSAGVSFTGCGTDFLERRTSGFRNEKKLSKSRFSTTPTPCVVGAVRR